MYLANYKISAYSVATLLADLKPCASNEEAMNQWSRTALEFIADFGLTVDEAKAFAVVANLEHYS